MHEEGEGETQGGRGRERESTKRREEKAGHEIPLIFSGLDPAVVLKVALSLSLSGH